MQYLFEKKYKKFREIVGEMRLITAFLCTVFHYLYFLLLILGEAPFQALNFPTQPKSQ